MSKWLNLWVFLMAAAMATAAPPTTHVASFLLAGHGALSLTVPETWQSSANQPPEGMPPTISLSPRSGQPFQILLTPIWPMSGRVGTDDIALRNATESAAARALTQAVERALPLRELNGSGVHGYSFRATDCAPKPDEYKFLTQGMARVGSILLTFTILTNDGQSEVEEASLKLVSGARYTPESH